MEVSSISLIYSTSNSVKRKMLLLKYYLNINSQSGKIRFKIHQTRPWHKSHKQTMANSSIELSSSPSRNDPQSNGNEQLVAAASKNGRCGMERDVYLAAENGKVEKLRWLNWKHQKTPTGNNVLHVHVGKPLETIKGNLTDNVNLQFVQYVLDETVYDSALLETNDKGDTPLLLAVRFGHNDAVQEFLKRAEVVRLLNKTNNNMDTLLHDAARNDNATMIKVLAQQASEHALELDHMPNKFGETPLFLAAERGHVKSFGALFELTGLAALAHRGPCGQTALHAAVLLLLAMKH